MHRYHRTLIATFAHGVLFTMGVACGHPSTARTSSSNAGMSNDSGGSGNSGNGNQGGTGNGGGWTSEPDGKCEDRTYQDNYTPGYTAARDPKVDQLLRTMTVAQKALQMQGTDEGPEDSKNYSDVQRSPDDTDNGIRGYMYRDAGRGLNLDARQFDRTTDGKDYATVMPTASARGASFDLDLEYRIGEALGDETVASKNTMLLAPCMNILRHPYWGRSQETYGEDVFHLGRMGSALTAGIQKHIAACAKHFAGNNIEDGRANQNATIKDEQTLREIYARHFEMVVQEGGVACVMAAYNSINGTKCTKNKPLLTDILRNDMGFRGVVLSDWWAMPGFQAYPSPAQAKTDAAQAVLAGLNIEVPWTLFFGQLETIVTENAITMADLDKSVGYILEQKIRFNSLDLNGKIGKQPTTKTSLSGGSISGNAEHIELSREAAVKSMVLLKNAESTLPVKSDVKKIAVIGMDVNWEVQTTTPTGPQTMRFSTDQPIGDRGSSRVNADPATTTGPYAGISEVGKNHSATAISANSVTDEVKGADLIVVMVGYTPGDEGEEYAIMTGGDRSTLTLPHNQDALIAEAVATGKPTVVVIQSGSVINMPWLDAVKAVVWSSYSGQRGGLALAQLLFGEANFSGKMPVAWPKEADLPAFRDEPSNTTMDYFIGYRYFDKQGKKPIFPYGHGLSYSNFSYSTLALPCGKASKKAVVDVKVDVKNNSQVDGEEIAFLFVAYPNTKASRRSVKELKGFKKLRIAAGQTAQVIVPLRVADLKYWNGDASGHWEVESGDVTIMVGPDAEHLNLTGTLTIE